MENIFKTFILIGKLEIQRGGEKEKDLPSNDSLPKQLQWPELHQSKARSQESPMRVQGLKALGHPLLLSQATSRELDGKQGCCWDENQHPNGIPALAQ